MRKDSIERFLGCGIPDPVCLPQPRFAPKIWSPTISQQDSLIPNDFRLHLEPVFQIHLHCFEQMFHVERIINDEVDIMHVVFGVLGVEGAEQWFERKGGIQHFVVVAAWSHSCVFIWSNDGLVSPSRWKAW